MKRARYALALFIFAAVCGCGAKSDVPPPDSNPFFVEWTTPYEVPPWDAIELDHFLPAVERGIAEQRQEVEAVAENADPPTFANTVGALDAAGALLDRVESVLYTLAGSDTSDELQAITKEVAPLRSNLRDDILMDPKLFARVKAVYERRDALELTAEEHHLLEETYLDFVGGGAELDEAGKARLREINTRMSTLTLSFSDNVLAATNRFKLWVDDEADLAGLPAGVVTAAAEAAAAAGEDGRWLFTLHGPSIWPFLQSADNRELRQRILEGYISRCDEGDELDNKAILTEIAALRAESARLLGYQTFADFVLERRMAQTPENVGQLLTDLWHPALGVAREEAAALQAAIAADGFDFALAPWDWRYYAEKVRQARYDVDETAIRAYFELDNVIAGAFEVAGRLYGIGFEERTDIPTYHPEVRTYVVTDADGSHLGVFMTDYFPRPGKRGGAWSRRVRGQWVEDGREIRPVVLNVGNFSRPAGDAPALLSLDEVHTLFHELGHGLQALLSDVSYRGSAGVTRDFVELPSQIMENWLLEPEVLKLYAKHYQTGEVIPNELIEKIRASEQFNQGFATVEYLAACFLDMDWHTLEAPVDVDPTEFEQRSLAGIGLLPEIVARYRSPYFGHIFSSGYPAGYYSYVWSEVLDADAFEAFKERGLFDLKTAASFRANILAPGGSEDPDLLWQRFRGREPSVEPLLRRRGIK